MRSPDDNVISFEHAQAERHRKLVEAKTGIPILEIASMAIQAERDGATPHEVRAILDGDLSWFDR